MNTYNTGSKDGSGQPKKGFHAMANSSDSKDGRKDNGGSSSGGSSSGGSGGGKSASSSSNSKK